MAAKSFEKVPMDPSKVQEVLLAAGVADLKVKELKPTHVQYLGSIDGTKFFINIFIKDGSCTVGRGTGHDENVFIRLATLIVENCRWGKVPRLELSLHKFEQKNVDALIEFLQSMGAEIAAVESAANYKLTRLKGPKGDTLACKYYSNGTVQLQGKHAQVAVWTLDYLRTVLSLEELLEQQRTAFELPLSVEETKRELRARIPAVHDSLMDEVRMQLSSALALSNVAIQLEDYAALAFPALRGLEGFCFQLLRDDGGLAPSKAMALGDYFEKAPAHATSYTMKALYASNVAKCLQDFMGECYTRWHQQRHRLFHMDGTVETTRILTNRAEAASLVDEVFELLDRGYTEYVKVKP